MVRSGRRIILATSALLLTVLLTATVFAQGPDDDPRNESTDYFDAVNGAKCLAHHEHEGLRPGTVRLVDRYSQLPIDEVVPLKLRLEHNSRLTQQIMQMAVVVNTEQAPNVQVIHEDLVEDFEATRQATLTAGDAPHKEKFEVVDGASDLYVGVRTTQEPFGSAIQNPQGELDIQITTPNGRTIKDVKATGYAATLHMTDAKLRDAGTGEFQVTAGWQSDFDDQMDIEIVMMVNYTQTETEFIFRAPGEEQLRAMGERWDFEIPIRLTGPGTGIIDFRVQSISYWAHSATDAAPRDDGLYYRFTTMKVSDGDTIVRLDTAAGPQPLGPAVDLYNLFTKILGFTAAFLIPIAMLTGGVFGKASRRWLNKITGGAKKRVLWHSAMSWIIILVATFHFVLAIIEKTFLWTTGLLWGGVGWALLISLGFTGYYQVRMIKRWNYKVWRHTHLWSAVAVVAFSLVHVLVDGSDLKVVREALPGWVERLSWP